MNERIVVAPILYVRFDQDYDCISQLMTASFSFITNDHFELHPAASECIIISVCGPCQGDYFHVNILLEEFYCLENGKSMFEYSRNNGDLINNCKEKT